MVMKSTGVPPYNPNGTVVVASIWLALYIVMVISSFVAPAGQNQPTPLAAQRELQRGG